MNEIHTVKLNHLFKRMVVLEQAFFGMPQLDNMDLVHFVLVRDERRLLSLLKGWATVRASQVPRALSAEEMDERLDTYYKLIRAKVITMDHPGVIGPEIRQAIIDLAYDQAKQRKLL